MRGLVPPNWLSIIRHFDLIQIKNLENYKPSLTNEKIDKLLKADKDGFSAPTHNDLTKNQRFQLSDADVKTLNDTGFLTPVETKTYKHAKQALDGAKQNLQGFDKAKTKELKDAAVTGKAVGEKKNMKLLTTLIY
jgi:hypothetical protein